jgi:hypothetical protein
MEVLKPELVDEHQSLLASKRLESATATNPSPAPPRALGLSWTFFDGPSAVGQGGYGPADGGRRNPLSELLLEGLAVLF